MNKTTLFLAVVALAACKDESKSGRDHTREPETPVIRQMTSRALFGETPIDNRFLDPMFSSIDGSAWIAFNETNNWPNAVRSIRRGAPLSAPVLLVDKDAGSRSVMVNGMAKGVPGPFELTVWVGRPVDADNPQAPEISFTGFFAGIGEQALDVSPDPTSTPYVAEGIRWERWGVAGSDGPIGWANLFIEELSNSDLLIGAPVLLSVTAAPAPVRAFAVARPRPMRASEADAAARVRRNILEGVAAKRL
jgi:hypothetical protein